MSRWRSRFTSRCLAVALAACAVPVPARAQPIAPASAQASSAADSAAADGLSISLLTFGPGDLVWERFGHNALWVRDARRGTSIAYNWGIFDFAQPGFLRRFLVGDPLYSAEAFDAQRMIDIYASNDRAAWVQELALAPAQRLALRDFVEWNALEANKYYRYDYFRDNCSTRIRDALDRALGGALRGATGDTTALSYRSESLRLMASVTAAHAGMDVALGEPADRPLTDWEAMFIPMRMRDLVRDVRIADGAGGTRRLVASERLLFSSTRLAEPARPPQRLGWFLLGGLALAALIALLGRGAARGGAGARRGLAVLGALFSLVGGVFGVVLTLAWAATNHAYWYRNENLFQFSPIALFLAVALPLALRARAGERSRRAAVRLSVALAAIGLAGFALQALPGIDQANGSVIAAVLPSHLALAWAVWRTARRPLVASVPRP